MDRRLSILLVGTLAAGACTPAAQQETAAPAAPDTVAVRAAIAALADQFETHLTAGHASAVAGTFTENATAVYYGFPTTVGRPAIESLYTGLLAAVDVTDFQINIEDVAVPGPDRATARGTATEVADSSGTTRRAWYRWAAAYRLGADSVWRLSYVIAFPDSMK